MNLNVIKEAGKLAAYAFVTVTLAGMIVAQASVTKAAFKAAIAK